MNDASHIAFFCIPAHGHVNPTLGTVAELVARGHRVSYAVTEEYAAAVEKAGANPITYSTTMGRFRETMLSFTDSSRFSSEEYARMLRGLLTETVTILPELAAALDGDRPDLVVHDPSCWTGPLLAARWRIPCVRGQPTLAENEHWSLRSGYAEFDTGHPRLKEALLGLTRLLDRLRVDLAPQDLLMGGATPTLAYFPREFQFAGDTFGPDVHFVGPCLDHRGLPRPWSPPDPGRPVLAVSLGTVYHSQAEFFRSCVEAFGDLPYNVVMAVGDNLSPDDLGPVPDHVLALPFIPDLLSVLRSADVFVNHASMASSMESLSLGVPVVAIPQMAEHKANADRIEELGMGRRVACDDATAPSLRQAVETVVGDPDYRQRAAGMAQHIRNAGGATAAADAVEKLLRRP
ncbi:macrolide family glycosyltransferase [Nocardiopsis kunsanensis]|uniref:macrolide family glycosyltransferase n=1 Tax=Nocardiopsis kunsanensis TaxID=141693 RepID=UPI00034887E4|nr:macrolide family glycosyltransferase [Nocardiopsis kunsanensis]